MGLVPAAPPAWMRLYCMWTVRFLGKRRQAKVSPALPELPMALQLYEAPALALLYRTWLRVCCVGSATVLLATWASSLIWTPTNWALAAL